MKLAETIDKLTNISKQEKEELQNIHPMQWLNKDIKVPIWKVKYSYTTIRNNNKEYCKYIFADEYAWDMIENLFNLWVEEFNNEHPERRLSNVQILDMSFMGEYILELE